MKTIVKKMTVVALTGAMAASLLSGCGEKKLDGAKTVATVNGTEIPMGLLSLSARMQQAQTEQIYRYFGITGSKIWSNVSEDSGKSYGEETVASALEELELKYLLSQKAEEYGVTVTDEEKTAIKEAAAAFMEANSEETLAELAVTQEQVEKYLELETIEHKIHDPIVADADITVDEEEAQQSSFSYMHVDKPEEEAAEDETAAEGETEEAAAEETEAAEAETEAAVEETEAAEAETEAAAEETEAADTETEAAAEETEAAAAGETEAAEAETEATAEETEAAEAETEAAAEETEAETEAAAEETEAAEAGTEAAAEETEAVEAAADDGTETVEAGTEEETAAAEEEKDPRETIQTFLDRMLEDPSADMNTVAAEIDDSLHGHTGSFTTKETDNELLADSFDDAVVAALRTLSEGEVYNGVIETDDEYYVVRLDKEKDEEATQDKIDEMIESLQEDFYEETTQAWLEEAEVKVEDKVRDTLQITDSHTFTIVEEPEEETETEAETEAVSEAETETETASEAETEVSSETEAAAETETAAEAAEQTEETTEQAEETTEAAAETTTEK